MGMAAAFADDPADTDLAIVRFAVENINDGTVISIMPGTVATGVADRAFFLPWGEILHIGKKQRLA